MARILGQVDLELLEQLLECLPDSPFFVKDAELRYVAANTAMAELCGRRRASELYGRTAYDFFEHSYCERYERVDRLVITSGRPLANKLDLAMSRSAGPTWLLFTRLPVRAADGAVVGVTANARRLRLARPDHATYQRLSAVLAQIDAHFNQPLRLVDLSVLAGTSVSQLERDFKTLFRISIRDFLQKTRVDRALEFLATGASIAAIAYDCGYTDQSAFSRSFRRATGVSPRQYRQALSAAGLRAGDPDR